MSKQVKKVTAAEPVKNEVEVKAPAKTEGQLIWEEIKDVEVSVFNLPDQRIETLVAPKRTEKDNKMVEVPDVVCLKDSVALKFRYSAAIATVSERFKKLKFDQNEFGLVVITRMSGPLSHFEAPSQPFVVVQESK